MKIYQKAKDKNVSANIVYASKLGDDLYLFSTREDAENPVVEAIGEYDKLLNGLTTEEIENRYLAGNMVIDLTVVADLEKCLSNALSFATMTDTFGSGDEITFGGVEFFNSGDLGFAYGSEKPVIQE